MNVFVYPIAIGIVLIPLIMGCGGGGGGGDDDGDVDAPDNPQAINVSEEIADDIIAAEYPAFANVSPEYEGYQSNGRNIHSFTYMRTIEYESNGSVIRIPQNVVVNVDQASGETEIFLSN